MSEVGRSSYTWRQTSSDDQQQLDDGVARYRRAAGEEEGGESADKNYALKVGGEPVQMLEDLACGVVLRYCGDSASHCFASGVHAGED
jgi:hypothetical protein